MKRTMNDQIYLDSLLKLQQTCRENRLDFHAFMTAAVLSCLVQFGDQDATIELAQLVEKYGDQLNWAAKFKLPHAKAGNAPPLSDAKAPALPPRQPARPPKREMAKPKNPSPRQQDPRLDRLVVQVKDYFTTKRSASWREVYENVENHYASCRQFSLSVVQAAKHRGVKLR